MNKENEKIEISLAKKALLLTGVVGILIFLIFFPNYEKSLGYLLGAIVGIINFIWMSKTIRKSVEMYESQAKKYMMVHYIFRYVIYGLTFLFAIRNPLFDFIFTMIGFFILKITVLGVQLIGKKKL
jgi:membrane-bound ClpP family serine protease